MRFHHVAFHQEDHIAGYQIMGNAVNGITGASLYHIGNIIIIDGMR